MSGDILNKREGDRRRSPSQRQRDLASQRQRDLAPLPRLATPPPSWQSYDIERVCLPDTLTRALLAVLRPVGRQRPLLHPGRSRRVPVCRYNTNIHTYIHTYIHICISLCMFPSHGADRPMCPLDRYISHDLMIDRGLTAYHETHPMSVNYISM
jgi:hypothetical protein